MHTSLFALQLLQTAVPIDTVTALVSDSNTAHVAAQVSASVGDSGLTWLTIFGYVGALLMGLSLGLIGGGGSILTVPILVKLFAIPSVLSTAYSLFVVGLTSLVGSVSHIRMGNVHWRTALVFGAPSIVTVLLTRKYVMPNIPDLLFTVGGFEFTKAVAVLILFAILMVAASYSMIKPSKTTENTDSTGDANFNYPLILGEGLLVGFVTGLVGAGGGFLIIPVLVLMAKLSMKQAVGTSLIIIASKSLIGFFGGDLKAGNTIDWQFLFIFSSIAVVGILVGSQLSKKIPGSKLKPAFGWMVLLLGIYMILDTLGLFGGAAGGH